MSFTIRLAKENHKFSGSHFTIFGPDKAERMHGHNYYVATHLKVRTLDPELGMAFDFNLIKPIIRKICDELDERILIPAKSKHLKIKQQKGQVEIYFKTKFYSLPAEDTILLPVHNITTEELARHLTERLWSLLPKDLEITQLSLNIEETRGQSISYTKKGK